MKLETKFISVLLSLSVAMIGCQKANDEYYDVGMEDSMSHDHGDDDSADIVDHIHDDVTDDAISEDIVALGCVRPSNTQINSVNLGLSKKEKFLSTCTAQTGSSTFCSQVARPNPSSRGTFSCTYGSSQTHNLIHPDESTWKYPIAGIKILRDLQAKGIKVSHIYNWWRPEPYNKNVGGAAGRHPFGTSIDVRFASVSDANKAFSALCTMRKQGRLRAIGHYGSASLHIGVGDKTANTWGKYCN